MIAQDIVKALKFLVCALIIVTPLIFYVPVMFPYALPKVVFAQSVIEIMAGLWISLLILDRRYLPKATPLLIAAGVFLGTLVLSAATGVDLSRSLWSTVDRLMGLVWFFHFGALLLILQSMRREINWKFLWTASFIAAVLVAAGAIFQYFGLHGTVNLYMDTGRPGSTFGNAAFMGGYLLFYVFIGVWLLREWRTRWQVAAIGAGIALIFVALLIGQTIGVLIGLAGGLAFLAVYFLFKAEQKRTKQVLAAVIVLGVVFGGVFLATRNAALWEKIPGVRRVASFSFAQSDVQDRLIAWRLALIAWKERPILGWGWDNFNIPFNMHYDPRLLTLSGQFFGTSFDKPHNVFLEYLAAGGLVGLFAYLGLFGALGYSLMRMSKNFIGKSLSLSDWCPFFGAALIAYVVQNATVFDSIGTYLVFFFIIAFADSAYLGNGHYAREEQCGAEEAMPMAPISNQKKVLIALPVLCALLPVYYLNIQMAQMFNNYYWGANYFLNNLPESSELSWQKALAMRTPYQSYANKDFAAVIQQGLQQHIVLPHLEQNINQAIQGLEGAMAEHPKDYLFPMVLADLYNNAYLYVGKDRAYLDAAETYGAKALELSPKRQQIYYVLAQSRVLRGDSAGAKKIFKHVIALDPNAGDPHFSYALLAYQTKDIKTGDEELARAEMLGREPRNAKEAMTLGSLLGDVKGDYRGAIKFFKLARELAGTDKNSIHNAELKLAIAYYFVGDERLAKQEFEALSKEIDLTKLSMWPDLKPVLDGLGVKIAAHK